MRKDKKRREEIKKITRQRGGVRICLEQTQRVTKLFSFALSFLGFLFIFLPLLTGCDAVKCL